MIKKDQWLYYEPKFEYKKALESIDSTWTGHEYFVYDLIRNLKPKKIVELGTYKGFSLFSMCQAIKDGALESELYAVDTWEGDKHSGFYKNSVFKAVLKVSKKYYAGLKINLLKKTFDSALLDFKDYSLDLIHIDGLHTYEAVKHDFENWFKKLKPDGIVLLHDTHEKKKDFGVYKLWDMIKQTYPTVDFPHSHGLGVVFNDRSVSKEVLNIKEGWELYYSKVAENNMLKEALNEIKQKNKGLYKFTKEANSSIMRLEQKMNDLEKELKEKEAELTSIKYSKLWKAREIYAKVKNGLFSPRKDHD